MEEQKNLRMSKAVYFKRRWEKFEKLSYLALFYKNPPKRKGWRTFQIPSKLKLPFGIHSTRTWVWGTNELDFDFYNNLPDSCLAIKINGKWYGPRKNIYKSIQDIQIQSAKQFIEGQLKLLRLFKKKPCQDLLLVIIMSIFLFSTIFF